MVKKFGSDARNNFADIACTISRSYDKADELNFHCQTMTSIFEMGTSCSLGIEIIANTTSKGTLVVSLATLLPLVLTVLLSPKSLFRKKPTPEAQICVPLSKISFRQFSGGNI